MNLKASKTNKNKFERGQDDVFTVEAVDIGPLKKIKIGHDNKGEEENLYCIVYNICNINVCRTEGKNGEITFPEGSNNTSSSEPAWGVQ